MTVRDRVVLCAVAALAALAAGWFLVLAPKRDESAALDGQVAAARALRDQAVSAAANAARARRDYAAAYATVARLGKAIPADDGMPSLVYQLEMAARHARVDFRSVQLSGSGSAAPAGAGASGGSGSAPATQAAAATLPPGATVGSAGLATMPFSFTFNGSFFRLEDFLAAVNRFVSVRGNTIAVRGRLLTIDGFGLKPTPQGFPHMQVQIAATSYLQPQATGGLGASGGAGGTAAPATGSTAAPPGGGSAATPATIKGVTP